MGNPIFGPSQPGNPYPISIKFETDDYICYAAFMPNLVFVRLAGACPHIGVYLLPFPLFTF